MAVLDSIIIIRLRIERNNVLLLGSYIKVSIFLKFSFESLKLKVKFKELIFKDINYKQGAASSVT